MVDLSGKFFKTNLSGLKITVDLTGKILKPNHQDLNHRKENIKLLV